MSAVSRGTRRRSCIISETVPQTGGRGMNPPFLFFAKKRNGPFTVQREIAWAQNGTLCLFLLQYGGRARRCSKNLIGFYRVRRTPAEQRWYFPAFGGLGAAFGVVVVWVLPLAPRVPLRYVLPGRITGAAAEGDADQVRFAARHTETVHRGVRVYKFQQSRSRAQR